MRNSDPGVSVVSVQRHNYDLEVLSLQMTDNILEIETTALAYVACSPQESGILLTDFAAAYPSVNHSWIFHVLEKTAA